jgi:hypothetical protein
MHEVPENQGVNQHDLVTTDMGKLRESFHLESELIFFFCHRSNLLLWSWS